MAQILHVHYQHFFFSTGFMPLKCGYSSNVNYYVNNFNGQLCMKNTMKKYSITVTMPLNMLSFCQYATGD